MSRDHTARVDAASQAMAGVRNRARAARLARRAAQFSKFRLIQLNLVPLVDTFVSVVFLHARDRYRW
jgi:hypothetical protein